MDHSTTYLTKHELAKTLKVSPRTIDRRRSEGVITGIKFGNTVRFNLETVLAELAKLREKRGKR